MWFINDFAPYLDSHPDQAQQVRMPILGIRKTGKIESAVSQAIRASAQIGHAGELNSGNDTAQFTTRLKDQSC